MRTTTIPDMLAVISTNYNRRIEEARLFEMSKVYIPKSLPLEELPEEKTVLTLGMYGELDFYDLKGVVEELLERLGIKNYDVSPEKNNVVFHPGRTALINIDGEYAGIIGEIHPEVAESLNVRSALTLVSSRLKHWSGKLQWIASTKGFRSIRPLQGI